MRREIPVRDKVVYAPRARARIPFAFFRACPSLAFFRVFLFSAYKGRHVEYDKRDVLWYNTRVYGD